MTPKAIVIGISSDAQDAPLGAEERAEHAGVDRRPVGIERPHRVVDDRAADVALGGADHLVAAEQRLDRLDLGHEHAGRRVDAGADEVVLALVEVLGVDAVADVDDSAVGVALDVTGARLVELEPGGLVLGALRRPAGVPVSSSVPTNTTSGSAGTVAPRRYRHQPLPTRGGGRRSSGRCWSAAWSAAARSWSARRPGPVAPGRRAPSPRADGDEASAERDEDDGRSTARQHGVRVRDRPASGPSSGRIVLPVGSGAQLHAVVSLGTSRTFERGADGRERRSAALERRGALVEERPHGLGRVGRGEVDRLRRALLVERLLERDADGVVEQPLGLGEGDRRAGGQPGGQIVDERRRARRRARRG